MYGDQSGEFVFVSIVELKGNEREIELKKFVTVMFNSLLLVHTTVNPAP